MSAESNSVSISEKRRVLFENLKRTAKSEEEEKTESTDQAEKRFLSFDGLSYGPPSGSSLSSCNPSLEYTPGKLES